MRSDSSVQSLTAEEVFARTSMLMLPASASFAPAALAPSIRMRIPARFAPVLFGAILSGIMVAIVSGFVLLTTRGIGPGFFEQWFHAGLTTWPVAFLGVTLLAPWVRRVVARLTD